MAVLYTEHFAQFFDNNGNPLSNGKLYAYSAGTTTPKATFTTEAGDIEHPHPIELDAAGRATIFIQGSYRFDLFDANDALIDSTDDVTSFTTLNESGDPFFQSFSGTGAQTVFTLSESLGNDSKDIMVYVNDESGDVGYDIQNPSAFTLSGTSLTFSSAPPTGTDNIYVFAPTKLLGAASASAAAAAASEASAAASAATASSAAGLLDVSSTSSVEVGTGTKTFTVGSGLGLEAGQWVIVSSDANPTVNYMTGPISSYSGTALEVSVSRAFGSGTLADWTIKLSGVEGEQGTAGTVSATSAVVAATTAGASLQSSNTNNCISWGGGGGANSTLGGNMSGASTHKLVNMADGTSAQDYVTKSQLDNAGGGSMELLGSYTASSDTSVDIGSGLDLDAALDGTYDVYQLVCVGVDPATDGADAWLRDSADGGSTFPSSGYTYAGYYVDSAGVDNDGSTSASSIVMTTTDGVDTGFGGFSAIINIFLNQNSRTHYMIDTHSRSNDAGARWERGIVGGQRAGSIDAVRFLFSTGNISSGTFYLYGIKKS